MAEGDEKVVELGRHDPTVESVVTRLHRHMDRIKSITAVVQWDNGSYDVFFDTRDVSLLCYDRLILDKMLHGQVHDKGGDR